MADDNQNDQNTETPPSTLEEALALLDAERQNVTKWKGLSRTNEDRWKEVSQERDQLKASQMTDSEKQIEQARQEARNAALSEVGTDLVAAELRAQAASTGVQLPEERFINTSSLLGADGRPDKSAIEAFVSSLPKPQQQGYRQDLGLGRQGGNAPGLSREEYNRMSREDRKKAREDGRVRSALLGGND
ncbi:scaffolding protein [Streptomyces phage Ibantik]|uniref:Scaffolding protein n=1 Tax=Streptomyces phage Ibantik TaxID=2182397 RepID=A0A2U8UNT6_9CAUD|nr:scaffolding protein [Streptomyces phage Ibantik]AWN05292.1 scaffolding protein [Streptomyces phage Ibantik]